MAPELSIIIPILNDEEQLSCLLTDLLRQEDVAFEVIIADGGSSDQPQKVVSEYARFCGYPISCQVGEKGRGRQLNDGIARARASWMLLLHVDSRFDDPRALRRALDMMKDFGTDLVAGRFPLRFRRQDKVPHAGYYFYEWKSRLDRPECIHGDQGFLLRRETFQRVGHFRENMPVMEDTDFAERLRRIGRWVLLPVEVSTSARRFETEGLWQRQLLNALIMCFRDVGWHEFFGDASTIYRQQDAGTLLRVRPFFQQVKRSMKRKSFAERVKLWYACGGYVQRHAWQLAYALDVRRSFRQGLPVGDGRLRWVRLFEPLYNAATGHPPGRLAATVLLWLWFYATWMLLLVVERPSAPRSRIPA